MFRIAKAVLTALTAIVAAIALLMVIPIHSAQAQTPQPGTRTEIIIPGVTTETITISIQSGWEIAISNPVTMPKGVMVFLSLPFASGSFTDTIGKIANRGFSNGAGVDWTDQIPWDLSTSVGVDSDTGRNVQAAIRVSGPAKFTLVVRKQQPPPAPPVTASAVITPTPTIKVVVGTPVRQIPITLKKGTTSLVTLVEGRGGNWLQDGEKFGLDGLKPGQAVTATINSGLQFGLEHLVQDKQVGPLYFGDIVISDKNNGQLFLLQANPGQRLFISWTPVTSDVEASALYQAAPGAVTAASAAAVNPPAAPAGPITSVPSGNGGGGDIPTLPVGWWLVAAFATLVAGGRLALLRIRAR